MLCVAPLSLLLKDANVDISRLALTAPHLEQVTASSAALKLRSNSNLSEHSLHWYS